MWIDTIKKFKWRHIHWRAIYRRLKYEYLKLIRLKGDPSIIARGFSVGIFVEFITLPTFGLAFILLYPMNLLFRSSVSASLIGFVIGKITLPLFMLLNFNIGNLLIGQPLQDHIEKSRGFITMIKENLLAYLTGSAIMGVFVSIGSYFLIYAILFLYRKKRERRPLIQGDV
ncbi:DUF2062 domain-containing protein [Brevibacillus ginsengisoli]|uniref:DUF2062 domain-containing protein n=1 Tax=Brevibacillus ginsengisoli TaxID=363854 RepID=UPI003CF02A08